MGTHAGDPARPAAIDFEPPDDPRVVELVKEYEAEWERGRRPNRSRFLARFPDLAPALAVCLDGIDLLYLELKGLPRSGRPPARPETALAGGNRVGEFEIVRELGRGGMGVVYEAVQPSLNRRVAVKVLPRPLAGDENRLRRFVVEARAAATVAHPNIVPVHAVGEDRGTNYYVMRFVDGPSLDSLISAMRPGSGPEPGPPRAAEPGRGAAPHPSPDELVDQGRRDRPAFHRSVARLGAVVARALDHAHQNGVVHRDVKPANILLGRDGHVWVTDFGLARFTAAPTVTGTGTAVGTLRYMSPEQAAGDRRLDHRTDVYSLAATLYELLTGRPTFPAEQPAALLLQIAQDAPPAPRAVDPAIPVDLETVVLKGLEKEPRDRYATAAELADDLDRFLTRRPVLARRPSAWDGAKKWASRYPMVVGGAALFLVLLASASGVIAALSQRAYRAERDRADEAERRVDQSKKIGDLMIQISEEEGRSNVSFHGPRRRLLLAALENYRQLNETGCKNPLTRAELDRVTARIEALLADEKATRESWRVGLLWFQPVRAELGLSPEQDEQIRGLCKGLGVEAETAASGLRALRDEHFREKIKRLLDDPAARHKLLRPMTGLQQKRLGELFFRFLGPTAFTDPEVAESLALTPSQRQKIRLLQSPEFQFGSPFSIPNEARPGDFDPAADPTEEILGMLTPAQRAAWSALIGRPFEVPR